MRNPGVVLILLIAAVLLVPLAMWGIPLYGLYSERLAGEARLAEAQSSRRIAILEAEARRESAVALAEAEGAAKANRIIQDSLGGPEGYLRYLQIQALAETRASLIYVPTEAGLPVTEARRLQE
ncbi:membrane protease subunit [Qipengyuania sp. ASV99]|uniref:membrane protease subunit n=1 Tax=Qipengyuania sp. ASV99 TaxID=3399681 RepID=UPI003A4C6EF5